MKTKKMILTALFAALTAVGAFIMIPLPFSPVPVTMQTFFTLLSGIILGPAYGALSQLIYLFIGGIGIPVFAGGTGGVQFLFGTTAGFLWGFVLAAYVVGFIVKGRSSLKVYIPAMLTGLIVIYIPGMLVLSLVAGLSIYKSFLVGVLPFIAGDLVKIVVAAVLAQQLNNRIY